MGFPPRWIMVGFVRSDIARSRLAIDSLSTSVSQPKRERAIADRWMPAIYRVARWFVTVPSSQAASITATFLGQFSWVVFQQKKAGVHTLGCLFINTRPGSWWLNDVPQL